MIGIEPTICREISGEARQSLYEWSNDAFSPHLNEIPKEVQVSSEVIFDSLGLAQTTWLIQNLIPNVMISNEVLEAQGLQGNPYLGDSISDIEERNRNNDSWRRDCGSDIVYGGNIGDLQDWYSDSRFAQQQFTGTNPVTITTASKTWLSRFTNEAKKRATKKC